MTRRFDITIVGAGVIGASVAYHLAKLGARSIVIVERSEAPGRGSTGRATGGFRAQYGSDINVRLSLLAREALRRFLDEMGVDPGYRPVGYLWIARSQEELGELEQANVVQRAAGLGEAVLLGPGGVSEKNPAVARAGILGGAFCPTDGFIRPLEILRGYLAGAERLGVEIAYRKEVIGFHRDSNGNIEEVRTNDGDGFRTNLVIDAAGAWAAGVARLAGVDLPVTPLRRQVALTEPCDRLPEDMPLTIFMEDGFHLRERDGRVMLLWPTPGKPGDPFSTEVDPAWLEQISQMAAERIPILSGVRLDPKASWAGLYEMSLDKHAILGPAPGCANLYLVNGSSGHGVMHAPALGQLCAEMVLFGQPRSLDTSALRPTRFAEGKPNAAPGRL